MSGRPALIRQRDLKQTINAARKAVAKEVRVNYGTGAEVVISLIDEKPKDKRARPGSIADAIKRDLDANGSY
jgi:hypothetical protein